MQRLLITGGTVVTMTGRTAIYPDGVVAVAGTDIVYAGGRTGAPAAVLAPGWAGRSIDASGGIVMPGLINAHTHAAMVLLRGYADDMRLMDWLQTKIWPVEDRMDAEDIYWGTALACLECLQAGVTTFNDMYIFMEQSAAAVRDTGMRAVLGRGLIGVGPDLDTRLGEARELHRKWEGGADGRITTLLAPHAPYTVPPAGLEVVAAAAGELGVGIHIHLAETRGEVDQCLEQHGVTPIELMRRTGVLGHHTVGAHCVHVSAADQALLAAAGAGAIHCPVSNLKLACGVAPVVAMRQAGVPVGLGTDGAASANQLSLWGEIRLMALLQKNATGDPAAFDAYDALEVATVGGARALGLADRVGTLVPGRRADIIVVRADTAAMLPVHDPISTLAYSTNPGDIDTVVVNGDVVVAGRRPTRVDAAEVLARAAERARRLVTAG